MGVANGRCETLWDGETSVFLCETKTISVLLIARPRLRPQNSFAQNLGTAKRSEPLEKWDCKTHEIWLKFWDPYFFRDHSPKSYVVQNSQPENPNQKYANHCFLQVSNHIRGYLAHFQGLRENSCKWNRQNLIWKTHSMFLFNNCSNCETTDFPQ